MARFVFTKIYPEACIDLIAEVEAANSRMEDRFPGCSAEIVEADDARSVAVDFQIRTPESAACIDWYSAQLAQRGIVMVNRPRS